MRRWTYANANLRFDQTQPENSKASKLYHTVAIVVHCRQPSNMLQLLNGWRLDSLTLVILEFEQIAVTTFRLFLDYKYLQIMWLFL